MKTSSYRKEFTEPISKHNTSSPSLILSSAPPSDIVDAVKISSKPKEDTAQLAFERRQRLLLDQLLHAVHLGAERWAPILWPLVRDVAHSVMPDVRENVDEMDLLPYVHVKTMVTPDASAPFSVRLVFGKFKIWVLLVRNVNFLNVNCDLVYRCRFDQFTAIFSYILFLKITYLPTDWFDWC